MRNYPNSDRDVFDLFGIGDRGDEVTDHRRAELEASWKKVEDMRAAGCLSLRMSPSMSTLFRRA